MKNTLPGLILCAVLLLPGGAHGDETARVRARAPVARSKGRAARATRAAAPDAAPALLRAVGACDAAVLRALTRRLGRLAAMEECIRRRNPDASVPAPALSREAPRQSDLGIVEEAFDPELEVRPVPAREGRPGGRAGRGGGRGAGEGSGSAVDRRGARPAPTAGRGG